MFGEVGVGHAVVGQHGLDRVGEGCHHLAQEAARFNSVAVSNGDVSEFAHAADGQEQADFALREAQSFSTRTFEGWSLGRGYLGGIRYLIRYRP